jgi:hypothetical protein
MTFMAKFVLPYYSNQLFNESGIDTWNQCLNKNHFLKFPWPVEYQYNSRGYRDQEWPSNLSELSDAIWCFGDSFTVGLGSPLTHTWVYVLSQKSCHRTINVSMDGASNNWIARKISELSYYLVPKTIVVHWSYVHRREAEEWKIIHQQQQIIDQQWQISYLAIKDPAWPNCKNLNDFFDLPDYIQQEIVNNHVLDDVIKNYITTPLEKLNYNFDVERRIRYDQQLNDDLDFENTVKCINIAENISKKHSINLIHSFIPEFAKPLVAQKIQNYLIENNINFIKQFERLDWARDHHHYDIKTSEYFVQQICKKLNIGNH